MINLAPGIFFEISPPIAGLIVARYELIPGMRILYLAGAGFILAIAALRTLYLEETIEVTTVEHNWITEPCKRRVEVIQGGCR